MQRLTSNTSHYFIHEMKRNMQKHRLRLIITIKNTVISEILSPSQILAGITIQVFLCVDFRRDDDDDEYYLVPTSMSMLRDGIAVKGIQNGIICNRYRYNTVHIDFFENTNYDSLI